MRTKTTVLTLAALLATTLHLSAVEGPDPLGRSYHRAGTGWVQRDADGSTFDVDPEVITVKLRPGLAAGAEEALHRGLGGRVLRRAMTGFIDVRIADGEDVFAAIDAYLASGAVAIAEPNTIGTYNLVPNDPSYGSEWHLPQVSAEAAWDTTTGDPAVVVAVLDSGTEFSHDDLGPGADAYQNVWLNAGEDAWGDPDNPNTGNGLDDDSNGYTDDWKGFDFANNNNNSAGTFFHGTAVAGVIGAKTHNALGIAGVAGGFNQAGARIMIAGVGDSGPNGSVLDDAVLYAADNGARVIQLSLTVGQSAAINAAFEMAYDTFGLTILCASGNSGSSSVGYPSSNEHVIAVGATTQADLRSSFSQHGPLLEISAPGSGIFLLDLNDGYGTSSGTSFAAPLVSGVVALMLSVNPALTNVEIRQLLHDTADKVGGYDYDWNAAMPGHSFELGYGRVNAQAAVAAAASGMLPFFTDGFESGNTSAWTLTTEP